MRLADVIAKWERLREHHRAIKARGDASDLCEQFLTDLREMESEGTDEYVTIAQAAKVSGYSKQNLRRLVKNGRITTIKDGRVLRVRLRDLPRRAGGIPVSRSRPHLIGATAEQAVRESVGSS